MKITPSISTSSKGSRKILIGMIEIAGQYRNLSFGLSKLGIKHDFITYSDDKFNYGGRTKSPFLISVAKSLRRRATYSKNFIEKISIMLIVHLLQFLWGLIAIFQYNVFIFGYGSSLLPGNVDLPILKLLRKKVISNIGHGSEARAPYLNGKFTVNREINEVLIKSLVRESRKIANKVRFIQKYSCVTIGSPYSSSFFATSQMINRLALGRPVPAVELPSDMDSASPNSTECALIDNSAVRILHCPSDRNTKGTSEIIHAVDRLRNKGYCIDFRILENVPNSKILEEIAACDFVIDQLYSDLPMPAISTEAAMYGKPAIVAGYALEALRSFVPEGMWPPVYTCNPHEIELAIEDLIVNKEKRLDIGRNLLKFVRTKYSIELYAKNYIKIINDDFPNSWLFDPKSVSYLHGCGQSEKLTRDIVLHLVKFGGVKCLSLNRSDILKKNTWIGIF